MTFSPHATHRAKLEQVLSIQDGPSPRKRPHCDNNPHLRIWPMSDGLSGFGWTKQTNRQTKDRGTHNNRLRATSRITSWLGPCRSNSAGGPALPQDRRVIEGQQIRKREPGENNPLSKNKTRTIQAGQRGVCERKSLCVCECVCVCVRKWCLCECVCFGDSEG